MRSSTCIAVPAAIERRWVRRYEGESASTDDFIALASKAGAFPTASELESLAKR